MKDTANSEEDADTTTEFIFNTSTDTVHRGTREGGPECGTHIPSEVGSVDASDAEEAVMKYNLVPCSKCIDRDLLLNRWRVDVHGATVIHNADTPDRWKDAF